MIFPTTVYLTITLSSSVGKTREEYLLTYGLTFTNFGMPVHTKMEKISETIKMVISDLKMSIADVHTYRGMYLIKIKHVKKT